MKVVFFVAIFISLTSCSNLRPIDVQKDKFTSKSIDSLVLNYEANSYKVVRNNKDTTTTEISLLSALRGDFMVLGKSKFKNCRIQFEDSKTVCVQCFDANDSLKYLELFTCEIRKSGYFNLKSKKKSCKGIPLLNRNCTSLKLNLGVKPNNDLYLEATRSSTVQFLVFLANNSTNKYMYYFKEVH